MKYLSQLYTLTTRWELKLENPSTSNLEKVVTNIERSDLSEWTKHDYKIAIRRYFRWYEGNNEDPEYVKWIRIKRPKRNMPYELPTESEIMRMIENRKNVRDRAIIATFYDAGGRAAEIGELLIGHVEPDKYGAVLQVDGKTGRRRIRVTFCVPYLMEWISIHPFRKNSHAPLWITLAGKDVNKPMKHAALSAVLKRAAKRAGIEKRIYLHMLRHARSTELAKHLTQAQMEKHLGWVNGSNMPATYIHLSGGDVDNAILNMYGIKEEKKEPDLKTITCPRCKFNNGPTYEYCSQCGAALNIETAINADEKREELAEYVMDLVEQDPRIMKLFRNFK
ncbi:hypothetical protein BHR79_00085 [Methanohalophilus halophilus]|nr:hypothetical protein BHR79_00085 [Methanohalophilus halophilus]